MGAALGSVAMPTDLETGPNIDCWLVSSGLDPGFTKMVLESESMGIH